MSKKKKKFKSKKASIKKVEEKIEQVEEKLEALVEQKETLVEENQVFFVYRFRAVFYGISLILFLIAINFLLQAGSNYYFAKHTFSNVYVNNIDVSYFEKNEMQKHLSNYWDSYWESSAVEINEKLEHIDDSWTIGDSYVLDNEGDLPMNLLWEEKLCTIDETKLNEYVFDYAKDKWWGQQLLMSFKAKRFTLPLDCDQNKIKVFLEEKLSYLENPAINARYQFDAANNLTIVAGEIGRIIDYSDLMEQLLAKLPEMENLDILIEWKIDDPHIIETDLEKFKEDYLFLVNHENIPIELPTWQRTEDAIARFESYDYFRESNPEDLDSYYNVTELKHVLKKDDLRDVSGIEESAETLTTTIASLKFSDFKYDFAFSMDDLGEISVAIEESALLEWLNKLNEDNKVEATNAVLELEDITPDLIEEVLENNEGIIDGDEVKEIEDEPERKYRVTEFVSPKKGREIDIENSLDIVNSIFLLEEFPEKILLSQNIIEATTEGIADNPLQITELVALGVSNFAGSPWKRVHNIQTGANKINGLLLAPGEEWKTIAPLRPFNAAGGYLPELVIKGDKTIPEYGGGLCQVATTIFRAAIDGGLPVTQRRPHGYNVSYYSPIGTDATIYDPYPDFRFINDTGNYLLVQAYIVGVNIYIELWGVRDGRIVEQTEAINYNWTGSGAAKYVDNPELAPGVVNRVESAHAGVTGEFWRRVIYPNNKVYFEKWISRYPAKRAVYERGPEIGVEPIIDPVDPLIIVDPVLPVVPVVIVP